MAARKLSKLSPRHRDAIKTSMLINRLQGFALSEDDPQTNKPVVMSSDQVKSAIALLKKTIPDLAVVQHQGDADNPIRTSIMVGFRSPRE